MAFLDLGSKNAQDLSNFKISSQISDLSEYSYTIDVSSNRLRTLTAHPGTLSRKQDDIFSQCEVLVAEGNNLGDLVGIEDTFPNLVVLDVSNNHLSTLSSESQTSLAALNQLDTLLVCNNKLKQIDTRAPPSIGSRLRSSGSDALWQRLVVLELSSNSLVEVPDFSMCNSLTTLSLADNRIGALSSQFSHKLPHNLERLFLDRNDIDDWWHLVQLTSLSETISEICINDNAFTRRVRFSWRIFLGWLLPGVELVDGHVLTVHERDAVADLFRDDLNTDPNDPAALSVRLLSLMNPGNEVKLEEYLNEECRVGVRSHHPHKQAVSSNFTRTGASPAVSSNLRTASVNQDSWSTHSSSHSPAPTYSPPIKAESSPQNISQIRRQSLGRSSLGAAITNSSAVSIPPSMHVPSDATTHSLKRDIATLQQNVASHTDGMKKMIDRLQLIQDVVKVLRVQDMKRRLVAVIVIQKHFRRYLVRSHLLSHAQRERLFQLKIARIRSQNRGATTPSIGGGVPLTLTRSSSRRLTSSKRDVSSHLESMEADIDELYSQLNNNIFPMVRTARNKAAKTIQTAFRGYLARQQFKETKAAYHAFTKQFHKPASKIQATVRMFIQRRKYLRAVSKERELKSLKQTVKVLTGKLSGLERAMEMILSRLDGVEQLALLQGGNGETNGDHRRSSSPNQNRAQSSDKKEKRSKREKRDKSHRDDSASPQEEHYRRHPSP